MSKGGRGRITSWNVVARNCHSFLHVTPKFTSRIVFWSFLANLSVRKQKWLARERPTTQRKYSTVLRAIWVKRWSGSSDKRRLFPKFWSSVFFWRIWRLRYVSRLFFIAFLFFFYIYIYSFRSILLHTLSFRRRQPQRGLIGFGERQVQQRGCLFWFVVG